MNNKRSWLMNLFKPKESNNNNKLSENITMIGYEPSFSKFGKNALYSNLVYSALQMKSRFFGKLEPRHIRNQQDKIITINDSPIAKILKNPNPYQTTYDFLTQAYFMREKDKTCYIYADYYLTNAKQKYYTGLYILLPSEKPKMLEDEKGDLFIQFTFDGYNQPVVFKYDEIIVWKSNIENNQYSGGGKFNQNADNDLVNGLNAYHEIRETITEAAKMGCMFDGYLKINAYASDNDKAQQARDKFVKDIRANRGGVPVLDNGADYVALNRQLKMVDSATMHEIKENILIHTGVSIEMLEGNYSTQQKEAFYENHIEPSAISLGQAMSKVFFSQKQQSYGDQIVLYPHKVQLMATSEIVSIISSTISAGVFKIDEYREMLGYAPLENEEGQQRPRGFNNLDGSNNDKEKDTKEVEDEE